MTVLPSDRKKRRLVKKCKETNSKIRDECGMRPSDSIGICHHASFEWCSTPGVLPKVAMDWENREGLKLFGTPREYHWIQNLRFEDRRMAHLIADTSNAAGAASLFIADNGSCSASKPYQGPCLNPLSFVISKYLYDKAEEPFAILFKRTKEINVCTFQARPNVIRSAPIAASLLAIRLRAKTLEATLDPIKKRRLLRSSRRIAIPTSTHWTTLARLENHSLVFTFRKWIHQPLYKSSRDS